MIKKLMEKTREFFRAEFGVEAKVISVLPNDDFWKVQAEIIEEGEFLRQRAHRDLVAIYEVTLNRAGEVISFLRQEMRERGTIQEID